jgi:hypothetical protein
MQPKAPMKKFDQPRAERPAGTRDVRPTMIYRGKPMPVMTGEEIRRYCIQMIWELDPDAPTYH